LTNSLKLLDNYY